MDNTLDERGHGGKHPLGYTTPRLQAIRNRHPWPPPPAAAPVVTNRDIYTALLGHADRAGRIALAVMLAVNQAVEAHLDRPAALAGHSSGLCLSDSGVSRSRLMPSTASVACSS